MTLATAAAGCGGGTDGGTSPTTPIVTAGAFVVSTSAVSVAQGSTASATITVTRTGSFTGAVTLAVSGLPTGVTATFSSSTIAAGATTSTLTFTTTSTAAAGTTGVTIAGTGSGVSAATASIALTVTAPVTTGPFTMALSVSSFLVLPSNQLSIPPQLTIARNAGFTGAVALSTTGLPLTLGAFYSTQSLTGTTASVVILDLGTPAGTYTATVHGVATGGLGERTLTFQIVVAPATPGSIHWKFCSASTPAYFFAVKDGGGPWTRIMPGTDTVYSFNVASPTASVAMVTNDSGGYRTSVYQYTAAELAARAASQCVLYQNASTRTANGSFANVTGFRTSQVGMGWWFGSANGNGTFSLLNLPSGPLDLVAMRNGDISTLFEIPVDRAIIRRGINPASGATLPVLDFAASESFAPTTSAWTFNNVGAAEQMSVSQLFVTPSGSSGAFSLYPGVDRAQTTRTIYGIPLAQTIAGDLHQVVATINTVGVPSAAPNRASRQIVAYARTLTSDRTLSFGPAMPAPSVTAVAAGRLRATGTLPTEYSAGVSLDVTQTTTARFASVHTTKGFLSTTGVYDIQMPDLSSATGWDTQFAIRTGAATNWWVSGGGPMLDFYDGRYLFNSTRSRWTGAQTGIVAPADGATYLMGRAIGNTTP
ncbi:MAG: hypothetical protein ABI442_01045 [Gemmatimonadaceae bacterium]